MRSKVVAVFAGLAVFVAGGLLGGLAHREGWIKRVRAVVEPEQAPAPRPPGWPNFMKAPPAVSAETADRLAALGYLSGYETTRPAATGVRTTPEAQPGWTLYTSGHGPEALLLDSEGRLIHKWHFDASGLDPSIPSFWRRARVEPNGDLYAIYDYQAVVKLDRESHLLWRFDGGCHHDLDVTADGRVWVITQEPRTAPQFPGRQIYDNSVAILAPDGKLIRKFSILDAFLKSPFAPLVLHTSETVDVLHTNTITVLDGKLADRIPAFREGNLLVSLRSANALAVIDPTTERVVWALAGPWSEQHEPTVVEGGRLLVFDNHGRDGESRVIEIDPTTQQVAWIYPMHEGQTLNSIAMGEAQRLSNGNTLIVESTRGHAIEVTLDGRIVWEFWNPHRAGNHGELIATVPHLQRLPAEFQAVWQRRATPESAR